MTNYDKPDKPDRQESCSADAAATDLFSLRELSVLTLLLIYSCTLLVFRMRVTGSNHYSFLFWNLFLAEIPLIVAVLYGATRKWLRGWIWLLLCLFAWLSFFPNSPYVITDLQHLHPETPMPRWFDPLLLVSAALSGLWAAFLSLRIFETELRRRLGAIWAQGFVAVVWFLTGIGIYLGRVLRFNSWDILRHPGKLLDETLAPFLNPGGFSQALGLILLYSSFFWLSYLFWRSHHASDVKASGSSAPVRAA